MSFFKVDVRTRDQADQYDLRKLSIAEAALEYGRPQVEILSTDFGAQLMSYHSSDVPEGVRAGDDLECALLYGEGFVFRHPYPLGQCGPDRSRVYSSGGTFLQARSSQHRALAIHVSLSGDSFNSRRAWPRIAGGLGRVLPGHSMSFPLFKTEWDDRRFELGEFLICVGRKGLRLVSNEEVLAELGAYGLSKVIEHDGFKVSFSRDYLTVVSPDGSEELISLLPKEWEPAKHDLVWRGVSVGLEGGSLSLGETEVLLPERAEWKGMISGEHGLFVVADDFSVFAVSPFEVSI